MKPSLRLLPTEVWVDILCFPWASRSKIGAFVDRIGNAKFAEFLQFYLHEWGKHTIGHLEFTKRGLRKYNPIYLYGPMEIPQTPMPEKIIAFSEIQISHFDAQTIDFLQRIQPLLANVNLTIMSRDDWKWNKEQQQNLRTILANLPPLLNGIHSVQISYYLINLLQEFAANLLDQCKVLSINLDWLLEESFALYYTIDFFMDWLTSERGTEPKLFKANICDVNDVEWIISAIKQNFLSAEHPCTFAVQLRYSPPDVPIADFHLENNIGEQLHGQEMTQAVSDEIDHFFQITRHQANANAGAQLQEWVEENDEKRGTARIQLCDTTTIGQIDATGDGDEVNGGGEGKAADQPSTSKG